jgi:murein DD-endopeptidase MepM/ murein hydrolase activator NlpD
MLSCLISTAALAQDTSALPQLHGEPVLMRDGAVAGHEALHGQLSAGKLELGQDEDEELSGWALLQPSAFQTMFARSLGSALRWTGLDALDAEGNLSPVSALHAQVVAGCERWFGMGKPSVRMRISSRFGMRFHPILKKWKLHGGVDFAAPTGTPVHAAADGVIKSAGWAGPAGKMILIKHDGGRITGYAHLSKIMPGMTPGARVTSYDVIGQVGTTGRSTGPHLHFTLREDGKLVDPLKSAFSFEAPIRSASDFEVAYRKEIKPILISLLTPASPSLTANR